MTIAMTQLAAASDAAQQPTSAMSAPTRIGDQVPAPPRSRRVFYASNAWYFETREGASVGPYKHKQDADSAVIEYSLFAKSASPTMLAKLLQHISATPIHKY